MILIFFYTIIGATGGRYSRGAATVEPGAALRHTRTHGRCGSTGSPTAGRRDLPDGAGSEKSLARVINRRFDGAAPEIARGCGL
ncbi:MAG: hypothetical protein LBS86_08310 [Treponema sp.]|nr:hypothetical protein [Treponema sp.]